MPVELIGNGLPCSRWYCLHSSTGTTVYLIGGRSCEWNNLLNYMAVWTLYKAAIIMHWKCTLSHIWLLSININIGGGLEWFEVIVCIALDKHTFRVLLYSAPRELVVWLLASNVTQVNIYLRIWGDRVYE